MISKAHNNGSFKATMTYLLTKEGAVMLDQGGLTENTSLAQKIRELTLTALESRRAKKPVYHLSLAVSPDDRGKLKDEDFRTIARDYLKTLGLQDNQFVLVKHTDTEHEHVHLVVNRVKNGKAVSMSNDHYKLVAFDRQIEQKYGLVIAPRDLRQDQEQKQAKGQEKGKAKAEVKLPCELNQSQGKKPEKAPERESSNAEKLGAWQKNAAEAVKVAEKIEGYKNAREPVPPDLWVEMRERAARRDKAAEVCINTPALVEKIERENPSLLKRLTNQAKRAKVEAWERAPHYVDRFKRWVNKAREHYTLLTALETKRHTTTTREDRSLLALLTRKRNELAHALAGDKGQLERVPDIYKDAIRNQNLDHERIEKARQQEQQQERQAQEHARRLELERGYGFDL